MGPNAGDQVLVVSVIGRSDGPSPPLPFTFTGTATDLPAHAVLPWVLNLSSRQNKSPLTAGATLIHPYRVALLYRHDNTEEGREAALPLVRVDDNLEDVDKPEGEFKVEYLVASGGMSDSILRKGEETTDLELPLLALGSNPVDQARTYWHLGCEGGTQKIYIQPVHYANKTADTEYYASATYQVNLPETEACVEQDGLQLVMADSLLPLDRLPFGIPFRIKATASGNDTKPVLVTLKTFDESGAAIFQPNHPPDDDYLINVVLTYSPDHQCHLSPPLMALMLGEPLGPLAAGAMQTMDAEPEITFISDVGGGSALFQCLGAGAPLNASKIRFATDADGLEPLSFNTVADPSKSYYLRLELAHHPLDNPPGTFDVPYCYKEPGYAYEDTQTFTLDLTDSSRDDLAVYLKEISIPQDQSDQKNEFLVLNTGHPQQGKHFVQGIKSDLQYQFSRGQTNYPVGNCDLPDHPCDYAQIVNLLNNNDRITSDKAQEIPYLDINLLKTGGVQIIQSWLFNLSISDKMWIKNQADVIFFNGHGVEDGEICLRYNCDDDYKYHPLQYEVDLFDNWNTDAKVVLLYACQTLSLCTDENSPEGEWGMQDIGFDPRCNVQIGSSIKYNANSSPSDDNCNSSIIGSSCPLPTMPASMYGGQSWRKVTSFKNDTWVGPKLYLGYYADAMAFHSDFISIPNQIIDRFLRSVNTSGGFEDFPNNKAAIISAWLAANVTAKATEELYKGYAAAAIDATDPNHMVYYALTWDVAHHRWDIGNIPQVIYNDLH